MANPNLGQPSVDAHGDIGGGAIFEELQERSLPAYVTSVTDRGGQQASQCVFDRETTGTRCVWDWRKLSSRQELVQYNLDTGKANDPQFKTPCEVKTTQHRVLKSTQEDHIRT